MVRFLDLRARRLGYRDYSAYLASPHWRAVRRRWRSAQPREKRCCAWCGARPYELHHVSYARLGRELLGDLKPLCRRCHEEQHARLQAKRSLSRLRRRMQADRLKKNLELRPAPALDRSQLLPPQG